MVPSLFSPWTKWLCREGGALLLESFQFPLDLCKRDERRARETAASRVACQRPFTAVSPVPSPLTALSAVAVAVAAAVTRATVTRT